MTRACRFRRYSLAAVMLALTAGCASTASDGIAVSDVPANALADCRELVIEPFAPVNPLDADGFDADYSRIEADLFSIALTRMLAGSGPWERVGLIDDENGRYRLVAGVQTYALNGTPEEQYRLWRLMIADICDGSYEPMDREGAAGF